MYSLPSFPIFSLASSHRGSKNRAGKPQWIRKVSDNSRELYGNQRIMGFLPIRVHLCGRFTAATLSDCSDLLKPRLRAQRVGCCLPHKTTSSALNKNEIKVILGLFFHTSLPPSLSPLRIKRNSGWPSWFQGRTTSRCCSRCSGTRDTKWKSRLVTSKACRSRPSISSSCHRNPTLQVKAR